jgi:tetratricopeptide (TPR) repeat protein
MITKKILIITSMLTACTAASVAGYLVFRSHRATADLESLKMRRQEALRYEVHAKKFYQAGDFAHAKQAYKEALSREPRLYTAYCGLGIIAEDHDHNAAAALNFYKKALTLNPRHIQTYLRISDLLDREGHHEKARAIKKHAFTLDARQAWFYEGQNHFWNGKLEEALACYKQALALTPATNSLGHATIISKMGTIYEKQNKTKESLQAYQQAVDLCPDHEEMHTALSCAYLAMGDYKQWAQEYEWRLQSPNWQTTIWQKSNRGQRWNGTDSLKDKTVLLICENGYGDMIQFIRFAPGLKKMGARLVASVQKPLVPLFSRLEILSEVVAFGSPLPAHDYMIPIQSLPLHFNTTEKNLPKPPYLTIEDSLKNRWKEKLASDKNFKVGLCWQTPHDHVAIPQSRRALDSSCVTPLFSVPGVSFYSLQIDPISETMKSLGLKSFGNTFDNDNGAFIDSAAVAYALDLVVTVDTSLAHLVGALNRPVWVMLPLAADVRWMIDKKETPWYPSMKLFRQKTVGDWRPVIEEIRKELTKKSKA